MSKFSSNTAVREGIIKGYRKLKDDQYQYKSLRSKFALPASFDENRVTLFRNYFLSNLYPPPEKRHELDAAFQHLDSYIMQPQKLFRIVLESASLLFKYGRHLPKIFRAGIRSLRSFRTATRFEQQLIDQAIQLKIAPPYDKADISKLLKRLSNDEIETFIANSETLFETLYDRELVTKIISIMGTLIERMRKRPNLFSFEEIRGLEMGLDIIEQGNIVFDKLSKKEQVLVFDFVVMVEREFLREIREEGSNEY